ncbi:unnamed protein product [Vitrella brassicaformis CCMP3155]|uniref:Uncharacterized protein n=1 Tax=Vitrella brassicaformis (strain CCMP3155) TaxID=1169540 RepID=A0A0G4EG37_VITBC|nr:unnamed protein product [Vitrella brassicaformis CCMP3155]|eukprot:CEL94672.1 unnamed protein product [Vitrella brassicaformis CCMP3155]
MASSFPLQVVPESLDVLLRDVLDKFGYAGLPVHAHYLSPAPVVVFRHFGSAAVEQSGGGLRGHHQVPPDRPDSRGHP